MKRFKMTLCLGILALGGVIAGPMASAEQINALGARLGNLSHAVDSAALELQNSAGGRAAVRGTGETSTESTNGAGAGLFLSLFAPLSAEPVDSAVMGWEVY